MTHINSSVTSLKLCDYESYKMNYRSNDVNITRKQAVQISILLTTGLSFQVTFALWRVGKYIYVFLNVCFLQVASDPTPNCTRGPPDPNT